MSMCRLKVSNSSCRNGLLRIPILLFLVSIFAIPLPFLGVAASAAAQAQPQMQPEELNYLRTISQTYVIGTLVSGDVASATIRLNGETRHVPLRQEVKNAYGVSRGWLAFTAKSGAAQEEFFVMDVAGLNPVAVLTSDRILSASW